MGDAQQSPVTPGSRLSGGAWAGRYAYRPELEGRNVGTGQDQADRRQEVGHLSCAAWPCHHPSGPQVGTQPAVVKGVRQRRPSGDLDIDTMETTGNARTGA